MAFFNIRVELHGANSQDYRELSQAMSVRGFSDIVDGDDGKRYKLPPGEYSYIGTITSVQVRDRAVAAAMTTGKTHGVRVTEGPSCWQGLELLGSRLSDLARF